VGAATGAIFSSPEKRQKKPQTMDEGLSSSSQGQNTKTVQKMGIPKFCNINNILKCFSVLGK
jgi:hypothetical protein